MNRVLKLAKSWKFWSAAAALLAALGFGLSPELREALRLLIEVIFAPT